MNEFGDRLLKVMCKIANYVPWQEEEVSEEDFRVLNQATGTQLADVAYENRINFQRFIKNSRTLIDEYNERILLTRVHEVNVLKRSLQATSALKINKPPPAEVNIELERAETESSESLMDINAKLERHNLANFSIDAPPVTSLPLAHDTPPPLQKSDVPTFASRVGDYSQRLSRHRATSALPAGFNSVASNQQQASAQFNEYDLNDFGELGIEEAAQFVNLDAPIAEKIIDSIRNRRTLGEVPLAESFQQQEELEIQPPVNAELELQPPQPELQPPVNEELVIQPPQPEVQLPIDGQQSVIPVEDQQLTEQRATRTQDRVSEQRASDALYENFRIAVEQAEQLLGNRPKRRMRRVREEVTNENDGDDDDDIAKEHGYRTAKLKKLRKRSRAAPVKSIKPWVWTDILSEIQFFEENPNDIEEEEEEVRVEEQVMRFAHPFSNAQTSTPMPQSQQPSLAKRTEKSLSIEPIAKRTRADKSAVPPEAAEEINPAAIETPPLTIPNLESFAPADIPQEDFLLDPAQVVPETTIQPSAPNWQATVAPSSLKDVSVQRNQHVTLESMVMSCKEIERRSKLVTPLDSRRKLTKNDTILDHLAIQQQLQSASEIPPPSIEVAIPPVADTPIVLREPEMQLRAEATAASRKTPVVVINGMPYYEFEDENGNKKLENKYQMDIATLYFQVRLVMAHRCGSRPWKMKVKDLIHQHKVKMGQEFNAFASYDGLWRLAMKDYFIPTFSDDEQRLLEIEIPLNRRVTESSEKENVT